MGKRFTWTRVEEGIYESKQRREDGFALAKIEKIYPPERGIKGWRVFTLTLSGYVMWEPSVQVIGFDRQKGIFDTLSNAKSALG
jgi:hypothetical protein